MDLEVVGRHALLFDDDTTAAFVNSTAALVKWNSLLIDRYDVRHLLSAPPLPRSKRRPTNPDDLDSLESELDRERYHDLPPDVPSVSDQQDIGDAREPANSSGYHAVTFSYGDSGKPADQDNTSTESDFRPPFSVPESLLQNLPPTEKVHQIIARTAIFVSNHGGQSEFILRVKQGDNPTFGFLMPDHPLHAYFRFLVDHQELLSSRSLEEENCPEGGLDQTPGVGGGGALSLLGSVYGTGEDEDATTEIVPEDKTKDSEVTDVVLGTNSNGSEQVASVNVTQKDEAVSKHPCPSSKDKASLIKRNHSLGPAKAGSASRMKKENDTSALPSAPADKLQSIAKIELPIVEPPSDLKRVIDKIIEFILKNGKEFEAVLAEQDVKHGRFPFLLPSNLYHPYYRKVLYKAEESKVHVKGSISEKQDKKSAPKLRESDTYSLGSDIPYDPDRKEKFKMVIGKPKKEAQDLPAKSAQPQVGVSVDYAAAAAILQAATRGIKNPKLEILSKIYLQGTSQVPSNDGGQASSFSSHPSSQPRGSMRKQDQSGEPGVSVPVAKAIAKTAAIAAAGEADSSEAGLSKEEKLKAERLKRAKMFAAMIKSGAGPLKTEPLRGLSVEPPDSGVSGSGGNVLDLLAKEREGSSVPFDAGGSDKIEKVGKKYSGEDYNERRSKRKYRARSERYEKDEEEKEDEEKDTEKEEEKEEEERDHNKHLRKKRHSRHSSHHSRDKHRPKKRHSSSRDIGSRHRHKQDDSSDSERQNSRDRHKEDVSTDDEEQVSHHQPKHESSDEEHQHSRRRRKHRKSSYDKHYHSRHGYKLDNSTDDEHRQSRHHHKHERSPKDEHQHGSRRNKHRKRSHKEKDGDLEEGEICSKSEQSKASDGDGDGDGDGDSREASVSLSKSYLDGRPPSQPTETTQVSDDLRAKIRAMLMATL